MATTLGWCLKENNFITHTEGAGKKAKSAFLCAFNIFVGLV